MLYNTLIFIVVTYFMAFMASRYALQLNTMKQLQQSRDALGAVFGYYERKHDEFLDLIFTLYDSPETYDSLSLMLEAASDHAYEHDPLAKEEIVRVMKSVAVHDRDIAAILIYKNLTGARYVYNSSKKILVRVRSEPFPFFDELQDKTAGRYVYGTQNVNSGSLSQQVYGISGTLGTENIRRMAGQFLVAYNTSALEQIFQTYRGKTQGRFILASGAGQVIFDSSGEYGLLALPPTDASNTDVASVSIDGKPYYIQTIANANRNYIGANLVPKADIDRKSAGIRLLIYGVFTVMSLLCAILYLLAGTFVSRRVNELIKGIKRVGANNLTYRIPLRGRYDEFAEIASRFNLMCNELQLTINREYISEIKKKNAELNALQAGINPHFLYNTLEAIRIKAFDDGNKDVAEMIVLLANLYRSIVRDYTFIPIRKEISICSMYLNIFSIRYASNLDYEIDVDPRIPEYGIPKNLLQPIVENYFVHGIRDNTEDNRFIIRGFLEDGDIGFSFENNGRRVHKERLEEVRSRLAGADATKEAGYGLSNVSERILLVYGAPYGLRLESGENGWTRVIVRIKALTCAELENNLRASQ